MRRESTVAFAQTAAAAMLWGTSFPVIALGIDSGLDPRSFAFLRFALAAPLMLGTSVVLRRGVRGLLLSKAVWMIAFLNAIGFVCQFIGQAHTTASAAALLVNTSLVFAAVGGAAFLHEKMGLVKAGGVVLALLGTVFLTTKGDLSLVTGGQLFGDSLYLLAAVGWGAYIVYAKKKTDETGWDPVAVAAAIVTATAVFILPVALTANWGVGISPLGLEAVLYTAIVNTALAFTLYQSGLRFLTATTSAVVLVLEIVTAVALSTVFLGEALNLYSWAGAALILVSVFLVSGFEVGGKSLSVAKKSVAAEGPRRA